MNNLNVSRLVAITAPLACLLIGGWAIWNQSHRLQAKKMELALMEKNLSVQKSLIETISKQPEAEKIPTAPMTEGEQASFLDGLRTLARDSQVTLVRWSNVPVNQDQPKTESTLPSDVVAILSTLEVRGEYGNVRSFLYGVAKAPRLLNFSAIKWSRGSDQNPDTVLSVTITRYVSPSTEAARSSTVTGGSDSLEKSS